MGTVLVSKRRCNEEHPTPVSISAILGSTQVPSVGYCLRLLRFRRPLSANAIADLLYPNEESEEREGKRAWVENITKSLFSVLYIEEKTNVVRACHLSVLDFIGGMMSGELLVPTANSRENTVPPFAIGVKEVHERMFDGCFAIMNRDLRFNICGLEDLFRMNKGVPNLPALISKHITEALQHVAVFWFSHLEQSNIGASKSAGKVFALLNSEKGLY